MKAHEDQTSILAGDIGGTKTNLALFTAGERRPRLRVFETYSSGQSHGVEAIVGRFLKKHSSKITSACFGIAGPVVNGRCKTTNLPWFVSEARIKKRFNWEHVRLINDLTATALSVPLLNGRELYALNRVKVKKGQNLGLVAPGTGLGQALLVFQNGTYSPISSEGGHADFSPNSEKEIELWRYLHKRFGHVSIERVLSGPGLLNIYSWLKDSGRFREPAWLKQKIKEMDPPRAITESAMNERHPLCAETLNMFVSILGSVSGNLALTGMTTGGVYLGGGIPPRILPVLKKGIFMKAFINKGRFRDFLEKIPVRVILNDKAALLGAAFYALELEQT